MLNRLIEKAVRLFSSLRLAVALLIVLALVSVFGTFIPQEQQTRTYIERYGEETYRLLKTAGMIDLYHSWGFRTLVVLLSVNLLVCSLRRLKGLYRRTFRPDMEKSAVSIGSMRVHNALPSPGSMAVLERLIEEKRYRVRRDGPYLYGCKGRLGPWGDMITHLSILLILSGALLGSLGFVGTVNVYQDDSTSEFYNWSTERDETLGFTLYVDNFSLKNYPVKLKVGVRERSTGRKVGEFVSMEGGAFRIPGTDYTVSPERVDLERSESTLKVYKGGRLVGLYDTSQPDGGMKAPVDFDYLMLTVNFEVPTLKRIASTVRLVRGGKNVGQGVVEINRPLKYGGLVIYQTGYGRDPDGRFYTGFQIVRDPGVPVVWAGFLLLMAGIFMSFFHYHRQVWACAGPDSLTVGGTTNKDWQGFMREYSDVVKSFMQEVEP